MSVINKMLNDIEQRERETEQAAGQKLDVLVVKEPLALKKIALVVLLLLILATLIWFNKQLIWADSVSSETITPVSQRLDKLPLKVTGSVAPTISKMLAPEQPQLPVVNNAIVEATPQLTKVTKKTVNIIKEQPQLPVVNNAVVEATPQLTRVTKKTVNIVKEQPIVDVVALSSAPQAQSKNTASQVATSSNSKQVEPKLTIKAVELTSHELATLKYQQGLKQQKNGQISAARQSWQASLRANSALHVARERLAASFYGANEMNNALAMLELGKQAFPQHEGYRLLMAQIYFSQQQPQQALAVLAKPHLSLSSSNAALELAASIAQHLQLWQQAQLNYLPLHRRQPSEAKWIIGLAISLDGQNKKIAALNKYEQFIMLPNHDDALYQYAKGRIKQLKILLPTREKHG